MFKTTVHCDVCDEKLEIVRKHTPFGDVDVIKKYRTKVWDTSMLYPHLCEKCALKIDNSILELKYELMKSGKGRKNENA